MKKIYILIMFTVLGCSTHKGPYMGKYGQRYASYGMFTSTIELKPDSTLVKHFWGDLMNDYSYGQWTVKGDTLHLSFDTITYPKSRYRHPERYLIKRKRLTAVNDVKRILKQKGIWDTLPGDLKRTIRKNKAPVDFKGTMRRNYYRFLE